MDCFLFDRTGLGFFHLPRAVLDAEMVAIRSDKPISGLYRDNQLRNLLATKDSAGCSENVSFGPAPVSGTADYGCCNLRNGDLILESA